MTGSGSYLYNQNSSPVIIALMKSMSLFVKPSMFCEFWVYGYDPETKSFRHFPYNENPRRALNTTSLKCCLLSIGDIDRREKIHACVWRFKVASCKRASLNSTSFFCKKKGRILFYQSSVYI